MSIKTYILGYILTFLVFILVDLLWLGVIAKGMYNRLLGGLLSEQINWTAAIIFYLLFVIGILVFAVYPAIHKASYLHAIVMGALFGFFTYATYDLTNLATLKGWPLRLVFIDIVWGVVLCAIVSFSGYHIIKWIN